MGSPQKALCRTNINLDPDVDQIGFIKALYGQKDYYRSISEILNLKFQYPLTSEKRKLDLYLLKSYYQLKDFSSVEAVALEFLREEDPSLDKTTVRQYGLILLASQLQTGREKAAHETWETYVREDPSAVFPSSESFPERIDPNRAAFYSGIVPGSGLLLSEQYGKAVVSFLLNVLFISGSYYAFTQQHYGISGLLMFFEISWYFGGKKASAEAAEQYNRRHIRRIQGNWIQAQLINNNLNDLFQETED
ncbi:hypothetical protein KKI24_23970 [bacterium]|nr:hypothetical protein [bacterium]